MPISAMAPVGARTHGRLREVVITSVAIRLVLPDGGGEQHEAQERHSCGAASCCRRSAKASAELERRGVPAGYVRSEKVDRFLAARRHQSA